MALIDSDNSATDAHYFAPWRAWFAEHKHQRNIKSIICAPGTACVDRGGGSETIMTSRSFTNYKQLDITNTGSAMHGSRQAFQLMNNGNFIVHSSAYIRELSHPIIRQMAALEPMTAYDAAVKLVQLIIDGCILQVVPDMAYTHAVHPGSLVIQREQTAWKRDHAIFNAVFWLCITMQHSHNDARAAHPMFKPTPLPPPDRMTTGNPSPPTLADEAWL